MPAITPELSVALLHTYPQPLMDAKIRNELGFTLAFLLPKFSRALERWYRFMGLVR